LATKYLLPIANTKLNCKLFVIQIMNFIIYDPDQE
jgi:hypothetical protein